MKFLRPALSFDSVDAFYDAVPDRARRRSPELDFGVWWTEPWENRPNCRVSWVENTSELYIVRFDGRVQPVRVIATIQGRAAVEHVMHGWADHCGLHGLRWLYRRLESLEPSYWCTLCRRAGGYTEISHDANEACPRCVKRSWEHTPESIANANQRRALELLEQKEAV